MDTPKGIRTHLRAAHAGSGATLATAHASPSGEQSDGMICAEGYSPKSCGARCNGAMPEQTERCVI